MCRCLGIDAGVCSGFGSWQGELLRRVDVESDECDDQLQRWISAVQFLVERAKAVVTDSGGITEETTVMGVPCITLRDNTERPETCTVGTNELIGTDPKAIKPALDKLFAGEWKKGAIPELWDGHTAERIVKILAGLSINR